MAEPYEITFALESQRRAIADAAAGAVQARQEQDRQERRGRRNRQSLRQDKSQVRLKKDRQACAEALGPGGNTAAMKAVAAARNSMTIAREAKGIAPLEAGTRPRPDRSQHSACGRGPSRLAAFASCVFWTWLLPAAGVIVGAAVLFAALLLYCFLA